MMPMQRELLRGYAFFGLMTQTKHALMPVFPAMGVADIVYKERVPGGAARLSLTPDIVSDCCPGFDTLGLRQRIDRLAAGGSASPLEKEVLLAMLSGPLVFPYPTVGEWLAAMAIRCNIATAAAQTRLALRHRGRGAAGSVFSLYRGPGGSVFSRASR
jgi:hypothetical protein